MAVNQTFYDEAAINAAIASAISAEALTRCPKHPDVLVAMNGAEQANFLNEVDLSPEKRALIKDLITSAPTSCPRCADEDD